MSDGVMVVEEIDIGLLTEIRKDMGRGRTQSVNKLFQKHLENPSTMSTKTLWSLYLVREAYRKEAAYKRLRLELIERILKQVPHSVKSKVDPKEAAKVA